MIIAILDIYVYCDGQNENGNCHIDISTEADPIINDLSQDAYEEWLCELGWLVVGEMAFCPSCRFELHN
uniref:Uncharacterized protein n=1 Tax=viral metagenome TaxID=1070528 RepID=A0A6M3KB94_9ZZZZ